MSFKDEGRKSDSDWSDIDTEAEDEPDNDAKRLKIDLVNRILIYSLG